MPATRTVVGPIPTRKGVIIGYHLFVIGILKKWDFVGVVPLIVEKANGNPNNDTEEASNIRRALAVLKRCHKDR